MKERIEDKIQCRRCHASAKFGMINSTKYYVRCSKCGVEVIIAGYQDAGPRYSESAFSRNCDSFSEVTNRPQRQFLRCQISHDRLTHAISSPLQTSEKPLPMVGYVISFTFFA